MGNFLQISIQYDVTLVTPRSHGQIMNRLYRGAMEHHREKVLPRHFQNVPETVPHGAYGYAPRTKKWQERKEREGRGNLPNVYSGGLRESVLKRCVITATRKGAMLTARNHFAEGQEHPEAVNGKYRVNGKTYSSKVRFPLLEQRRKELEAISRNEIARIAGRMEIDYGRLARSPEYARKRRAKIK